MQASCFTVIALKLIFCFRVFLEGGTEYTGNVTVLRYKFNPRNQSDGETALNRQYVTELKRRANKMKDCVYGELTNGLSGTELCAEQTPLK